MCKLLTEDEFEYQTKMGSTEDAAVLGVGYVRWKPSLIYEAAVQDNSSFFVHPYFQFSIEEDPSFYREIVEDEIRQMLSDGKSFWDIRTNTVHTLSSNSNISIKLQDDNQVYISVGVIPEKSYLTFSISLNSLFIKMSFAPKISLRKLGAVKDRVIDYNYYFKKSERSREISGYKEGLYSFRDFNFQYLPAEGKGLLGGWSKVNGNATVYKGKDNLYYADVRAVGFTPSTAHGEIVFSGDIEVYCGNNLISTQPLIRSNRSSYTQSNWKNVGCRTIPLPNYNGDIYLKFNVGYTYNEGVGYVSPWPTQGHSKLNIPHYKR